MSTKNAQDTGSAKPMQPIDAGLNNKLPEPEDDHSNQAGSAGAGVGVPKTGGSQSPSDFPKE